MSTIKLEPYEITALQKSAELLRLLTNTPGRKRFVQEVLSVRDRTRSPGSDNRHDLWITSRVIDKLLSEIEININVKT